MFRIRRVLESSAPSNKSVIAEVQALLREQFGALREEEIVSLPDKLNDPLRYRFQTRLFVAEKGQRPILGFALLLHVPDIGFGFLDFMASGPRQTGRGIGGALYERVREEARLLGNRVLLFECLPDDPALSPDPEIRRQNARRLKFYESYGAFPITGTAYETPLSPEDTDPPYMVMDLLGNDFPDANFLKKAIRAILERKYAYLCPQEYIDRVVKSFGGKGVHLRAPQYRHKGDTAVEAFLPRGRIVCVASEKHEIHHVKERGYVESPVRVRVILKEIEKLPFIQRVAPKDFPDRHMLTVHDADYVNYLKRACQTAGERSLYPYVFPIRNETRRPKEMTVRAGYYCIDTFTPLNANAYLAARMAVNCALTAAEHLLAGERAAYALVRPPGHHAERKSFGGFCYFANAAIAAEYLVSYGRVAILDVDYHHGNSQQNIFYRRNDVYTVSLHGNPRFAYPYFTGFADEVGEGVGYGYNLNIPLPEQLSTEDYFSHLKRALKAVRAFAPAYLVLALGLDTANADPTGTWSLRANDFGCLGRMIGELNLPTLIVQEGGYRTQTLGINARHFFSGLHTALDRAVGGNTVRQVRTTPDDPVVWRHNIRLSDIEAVRGLLQTTGVFQAAEIQVAGELVAEHLLRGPEASGYLFSMAEEEGRLTAYACYGPVPLTQNVYNLYWIAVRRDAQRRKLAGRVLADAEAVIRRRGGQTVYVETSSRSEYAPARSFYTAGGYAPFSEYPDFYAPGESKLVFRKSLASC